MFILYLCSEWQGVGIRLRVGKGLAVSLTLYGTLARGESLMSGGRGSTEVNIPMLCRRGCRDAKRLLQLCGICHDVYRVRFTSPLVLYPYLCHPRPGWASVSRVPADPHSAHGCISGSPLLFATTDAREGSTGQQEKQREREHSCRLSRRGPSGSWLRSLSHLAWASQDVFKKSRAFPKVFANLLLPLVVWVAGALGTRSWCVASCTLAS